ncbi:hypothetical protein SLEP1_g58107 [Rubroshorea leprosula]|uniref:Uncharacterized protein n=1 Tax=Rubroshorea leprosula TaxID=152421 RepID=A0AAV5MPH3_9ROSI|nr:hypothetical protein SLEP1_g58107 [Rubroshorea leprosula]
MSLSPLPLGTTYQKGPFGFAQAQEINWNLLGEVPSKRGCKSTPASFTHEGVENFIMNIPSFP